MVGSTTWVLLEKVIAMSSVCSFFGPPCTFDGLLEASFTLGSSSLSGFNLLCKDIMYSLTDLQRTARLWLLNVFQAVPTQNG